MKPRYLSHGFWHVSAAFARRAIEAYAPGPKVRSRYKAGLPRPWV